MVSVLLHWGHETHTYMTSMESSALALLLACFLLHVYDSRFSTEVASQGQASDYADMNLAKCARTPAGRGHLRADSWFARFVATNIPCKKKAFQSPSRLDKNLPFS